MFKFLKNFRTNFRLSLLQQVLNAQDEAREANEVAEAMRKQAVQYATFWRDSLATKAQTVVIRDCPWCGKTQSITVESEEWDVYQLGALVQEAFPDLNRSQRRILVSGICDSCWERMSTF
jgi:hypothetical protein